MYKNSLKQEKIPISNNSSSYICVTVTIIFGDYFPFYPPTLSLIIFQLSDSFDQIILCVPCDAGDHSHDRTLCVRTRVCMCVRAPIWRRITGRTLLTLKQVDTSTCRHVRIDGYKLNPYHVLAIHDVETSICCTIIEHAARSIRSRNIKEEIEKRYL